MTISTSTRAAGPFAGTGVIVPYPFAFKVFQTSDLLVARTDTGLVQNTLALSVDYTAILNADQNVSPGGTITLTTALPVGYSLTLTSAVPLTQQASLTNAGGFFPRTIEDALDRIVILLQQLGFNVGQTLRVPEVAGIAVLPNAGARANNTLSFDSLGNPVASAPATGSSAALASNLLNSASATFGAAMVGYSPTLSYSAGLGQFLNLNFGRTTAEIAAVVTPTAYNFAEGDIRRYGATIAAGDNSAAINSALLVSANGGPAAFIPAGTWKHTSTLSATLSSSMYGVGLASILNPIGCDGLTFTNQPAYSGSRFFRDFYISGTTTTARAGIVGLMLSGSGNRVTGINFSGISIQNFQYGMNLQGFWNCTWRECFLYNNYQGIQLTERNIKCTFVDCVVQRGVLTGAGSQYGFLTDQVGGIRSEDIVLRGCFLYNWDYGIAINNSLYAAIHQCDIDQTRITGVILTTVNGGCTVRDCWINTIAATATIGIDCSALGAQNPDKVVLDGNHISATTAAAGNIGVRVGNNQSGVTCNGNRMTGFETGIRNNAANNMVAKGNSINATSQAIFVDSLAADVEVGPNFVEAGTPMTFSAATPAGFSYFARGSFTMTLTGMTAGVTSAVKWVASGRTVSLQFPSSTGTSNTTAMTGTGMPVEIRPVVQQAFLCNSIDNSAGFLSYTTVSATGVLGFSASFAGAAFTATGIKGINPFAVSYPYL